MHEFAVIFFFSLIVLNANISTQAEQFRTKLRKNSTVYTSVTALYYFKLEIFTFFTSQTEYLLQNPSSSSRS